MYATETHTVSFTFTADDDFVTPAGEYESYRGRTAKKDGLKVKVRTVEVDLQPGEENYSVNAHGAVILVNGDTSGWSSYRAALTEDQQVDFIRKALVVVKENAEKDAVS